MENQRQENKSLIQAVLPQGMLEYFTLNKVETLAETINIYLEEKNITPEEYKKDKLTSKGYYDEIKVQDFPIRGKDVFLLIKRRRWINETKGTIVMRDWELVAKGTRMTKDFAAFLKVISGYQAGKL
jgi:hypothetical protein